MTVQTAPCKRHPGFQTSVSCGRCGDPVCPRCLVHAPVGVRCPDCGRAARNPVFDVPWLVLLRAAVVGLPIALVGAGAIWLMLWLIPLFTPDITSQIARTALIGSAVILAGTGYAIGNNVSRAVNRKRGTKLKILVCVCMFIAFTIAAFLTGAGYNPILLIGGLVGFYLAINKF